MGEHTITDAQALAVANYDLRPYLPMPSEIRRLKALQAVVRAESYVSAIQQRKKWDYRRPLSPAAERAVRYLERGESERDALRGMEHLDQAAAKAAARLDEAERTARYQLEGALAALADVEWRLTTPEGRAQDAADREAAAKWAREEWAYWNLEPPGPDERRPGPSVSSKQVR